MSTEWTSATADRHVSSGDPRAVLRAWGGADEQSATLDMGGWLGGEDTVAQFVAAVQAEAVHGCGCELACVVVEDMAGNVIEVMS
jgi:hypothetical protein